MSISPPLLTVPRLQVKLVPPALPVQVVDVALPAMTVAVGVPVSSMPVGRVSETTTPSASARPAPALLRTLIVNVKSSRTFTGLADGVLLTTCMSALVRTVVV
ncbi:MAG TPA: hypothetical protein PK170_01545, partial [Anaerolineae bacterium]|nr:hypothetical protein [Anaerolineae bacterium]